MDAAAGAQILLLAMGYPYVNMAVNAAQSLRKSGTQANIKLVTNLPIARIRLRDIDLFDKIEVVTANTDSNRWIKTTILERAEGIKNVFLDCDVEVLVPLNPILGLLESHDVAARNLPFQTSSRFILEDGSRVEDLALSEINTGVIFFNRNKGTRDLFCRWHDNFLEMGKSRDQPAFLKALLEARETRFFALPPMWNATPFPNVDLTAMKREPKKIQILHYRDPVFWPAVAKRLAAVHEDAVIDLYEPSSEYQAQRAAYSLLTRAYRSPLFASRIGRRALQISLGWSKRNLKANLRVIGERRIPGTSAQEFGNEPLDQG